MGIHIDDKDRAELVTALALFKADLGVRNETRDDYFIAQLLSARTEIEKKVGVLNLACIEDSMLISDFAMRRYRMRMESNPVMSDSLKYRIRNRTVERRAQDAE